MADDVSAEFRGLWDRMGITYDDFIRTTEERHKRGVQELFRRLRDNGFIYKGIYTGQYCVSTKCIVDSAGPGAPCPECGRPTETVSEENYFFKLSAFEDKLLKLYTENPDFIRPETRRNEVISFVRSGLARPVHQPQHLQVGHPSARRSEARDLRVARRAEQLHHRARLRISPIDDAEVREVLAGGCAHDRQRNCALPLRVLAGISDGRRIAAAEGNRRAWLAAV